MNVCYELVCSEHFVSLHVSQNYNLSVSTQPLCLQLLLFMYEIVCLHSLDFIEEYADDQSITKLAWKPQLFTLA